jgi:PAS domain S-box-containing protein
MFETNSIAGRHFISSVVVLVLLFGALASFWVYQEEKRFALESQQIRDQFIQAQKEKIGNEVQSTIDYIGYMKSQTEERVKKEIKARVYEAHALAARIYDISKGKMTDDQIKALVREALRPIRFNKRRGYYFATSLTGVEELFADRPQLEGKNLIDMQDTQGKYVIRDMIRMVGEAGEGFYEYTWTKPSVRGHDFPKIAFVKHFKPFDWFIGTGEYLDDMEKEIQQEALQRISRIRFGTDGYLFVFTFDGQILSHIDEHLVSNSKMTLTDPNGVQITKKLLEAAQAPGGGYVEYVSKKPSLGRKAPKLAYAKAFPEWQWVVGTGVYLDDIETTIAQKLELTQQRVKKQFAFILCLFTASLAVTILILSFLSQRIQKGINAFVAFFKKSAVSYEKMDESGLPFSEFQTLAHFSNKMVEDRARAEAVLKEREATLRSIFTSAPIGIGLVRDRILEQVNERLCEMLGYREEELLGKSARMVYPDDEEFERVGREKYDQIRQRGTGSVETRWKCKDGRIIDVLLNSTPLDPGNLAGGVTFTALDMTARKSAEQRLRDSEKTYRDVFNAMTDGLLVMDSNTTIVDVNTAACETYGYKREELIGASPTLLIHPDYRHVFERFRQEIADTGTFLGQAVDVRKDGSTLVVEGRGRLVRIKGKDCVLAILRDITERVEAEKEKKKTEAQLQSAQRLEAIGTLAGGLAHDFNNLLSVIQGNVSLMLFDIDPSHPHYENLTSIEKQVQSGSRLTRQLLGYARKGRYDVKTVSLNQLVQDTSEAFGRTRKDITVRKELANGPCAIRADQGQIEQILLNLYVNAADAMARGGDLFLKTAYVTHENMTGRQYHPRPGRYVLLTVTDTGMGMDAETRDRVFDPFFTTKEMGRGTGLGLASTYGIVKSHGGYIDVTSEMHKGTTLSIYLPATEGVVEQPTRTDNKENVQGKATVLVVDDEPVVLTIAARVLNRLGYQVLEAQGGEEALDVYSKNKEKIDITILDMVMPGIGGGEVYDRLKKMDPNAKVLLSSGYSRDGQAAQILQRGCNGFIQKPFTMSELSGQIRRIMEVP